MDTKTLLINQAIASQLTAERAIKKATHDNLVQGTGLSLSTIRRILEGSVDINMGSLALICEALGLDMQTVIDRAVDRVGHQQIVSDVRSRVYDMEDELAKKRRKKAKEIDYENEQAKAANHDDESHTDEPEHP